MLDDPQPVPEAPAQQLRRNDHLKSIFEKTGARTRGELSATLFFSEHLPRIERRVAIGDDASFVDAPRPRGIDAGAGY
jgi:hypothetical protein